MLKMIEKKFIPLLIISFILTLSISIFASETFTTTLDKINYYKSRYKADCTGDKVTDNRGDGFDKLYGTRNMMPILHGIAYRGGANNYYHQKNKRENRNPLPPDGLQNLADEGFSNAVYLYTTNFDNAKKEYKSSGNTLKYLQISGNTTKEIKEILLLVKKVAETPEMGPLYFHCWNGWHQSGYVASAILMQFCGYSNMEALQYWMDNAYGAEKGYKHIKDRIRNFKPFKDIKIDPDLLDKACPCKKK